MADTAKPKKSFGERAKSFGNKVSKGYASFNRGLDKMEGFIYGKPAKKPAKKKSTKRKQQTSTTKVVYVPYPMYPVYPAYQMPRQQQRKRTTSKKRTTRRK